MWRYIQRRKYAQEQEWLRLIAVAPKSSRSENATPSISGPVALCLVLLMLPMLGYPQTKDHPKGSPLKVESDLVNLEVVVTDSNGQRVAGLQKADFEVYEDGVEQEITHFSDESQSLRVLLLFDLSASMEAALPGVQQIATKFVDSLRAEDEVMVVTFAREIVAITDWTKDKKSTKLRILQLMPAPQPWGNVPRNIDAGSLPDRNTNLYGALKYVFDTSARRNIVAFLFSDGVDSLDRYTLKQRSLDREEILRRAEESMAPVYSACFESGSKELALGRVGPFDVRRRKPTGYGKDCKFLSRVAAASGGRIFPLYSPPTLQVALEQSLADLRSQYTLGYRPFSDKPGFHGIRVVVKRPNLLAQCRKGYRR